MEGISFYYSSDASWLSFSFFFYLLNVCACVCHGACREGRAYLLESALYLHHKADTQTLSFGSRHLYLLSHLTTSTLILFVEVPNDIFVLKFES